MPPLFDEIPNAVWEKVSERLADAEGGAAGAMSPLHLAAAIGASERIESLVASGVDPDA